jgi:hypothetical protein
VSIIAARSGKLKEIVRATFGLLLGLVDWRFAIRGETADPSAAPLAMMLREAPLRMTVLFGMMALLREIVF